MSKLEQLAREATDLHRPDSGRGHVDVTISPSGSVNVTVYVHNPFAFPHCEQRNGEPHMLNAGHGDFGRIEGVGNDLDTVLDRMIARVRDAVADTPAEQVAA